jgi:predicted alpha/beta hydrolase
MTTETIRAADGAQLACRVFEAAGPPNGSVVIGAAMGVTQDFYAPFAQWLARQGWRVTTFDYRGCGESGPPGRSLRGFRADLFDWARDYDAVIARAHAASPDLPLFLLGHSLGAQLPGLLEHKDKVSGMLCVAAGSGYWRHTAPRVRRAGPYFWYLLVPLATRLFGYFPGRRLRKIGNLPAGVMLQWRAWCLNPRYSVGAEGDAVGQRYAGVRFPVHALAMEDDELMTMRGIDVLMDLYQNAPSEVRRVAPREFGIRRIGHFGAFRREREPDLWPCLAQWLSGLATVRLA